MRRILTFWVFVLISLTIACLGMAYRVPTDAMKPTITREDMCVMNPLAYRTNEIERFDIVAFEMPETEKQRVNTSGSVRQIKRIVGLPGEKLEIRDDRLLINDFVIKESFEKIVSEKDRKRNYGPITIPAGEYFLLGDNRPESMDSRYFDPPTIKKADIYSKVVEIKKDYYANK